MAVTSFYFLCFFTVLLFLYYILPGRLQWPLLLVASVFYYVYSGSLILLLYPISIIIVDYFAAILLTKLKKPKMRFIVLLFAILCSIGILFALKYVNFGINTVNTVSSLAGSSSQLITPVSFLIPLGISFYTFSLLGYVIDVYNGLVAPQSNFLKFAAFGLYFPTMISGPIMFYREQGEQFFKKHEFDYKQVTFGLQRMLWGFFKKLVIAERLGMVVDTVYGNPTGFAGCYIWLATVCFAFQLYTDFSGCMDIVLGLSESLGITLPENFKTPFFSKSISEYWRRWHITLGIWMKEYVFYPLLRTSFFTRLAKKNKDRFGKKRGKQLTTFLAMLILWFTVGLWHGGEWKYIIGSGLLHWFYIVSGELMAPFWEKVMNRLHIKTKGRPMEGFRILRTFFLVCLGDLFFRAKDVPTAWQMLCNGVVNLQLGRMFTGEVFTLGLDWVESGIVIISLIILFIVSVLQQKESIRDRIARKNIVIRWCIWFALIFYVILLGCYGPGYSAAEFIYQGF